MGEKRVTIKDVAVEAGVSTTSVSLVLNGKAPNVSLSTRARIFNAAEKLHYKPNITARSLVSGKTHMVGIIVPSITNSFFAELVRLLQKKFAKSGYDILLSTNDERAAKDIRRIEELAGRNIDGLIIAPGAESLTNSEELTNQLEGLTIPWIFLDRYLEGYPYVSVDNVESGYRMADYLFSKGHREIGVITGPGALTSSRDRLQGLRKRYEEEGMVFVRKNVFEGYYDIETGEKAAERFLNMEVTAIFAFSDMQAYGVYKKLKELGKRVPEDISVVGFDDNVYSALLDKPLTTMRQPLENLAEDTVRIMVDLMDGKEHEDTSQIPAELVERESVQDVHT